MRFGKLWLTHIGHAMLAEYHNQPRGCLVGKHNFELLQY